MRPVPDTKVPPETPGVRPVRSDIPLRKQNQEFADHFRDGRAKRAEIGLVLFWINLDKLVKVVVDALP